MAMKWTEDDIPDLGGRTALVTGASSGLGFETARALSGHGASVILACRSAERGNAAIERIKRLGGHGELELELLDLANLESVREHARRIRERHQSLDLLIDNAGVMVPPLTRTAEGFELQIGVNHLGHFALTGELLPLLLATDDARIVIVSSLGHRAGKLHGGRGGPVRRRIGRRVP